MMKTPIAATFVLGLVLSTPVGAYDVNLAGTLNGFYQKFDQPTLANSKLIMKAEDFYKDIYAKNKDYFILDVRTDAEASMVNYTMPNSRHIALNALFSKENLDQLPRDKTLIVACHSGVRSLLAAVNLKMLGFKDVHSLEGGIVAFANATTPKTTLVAR